MRKILIPIDFSENSNNAIKFALELFKDSFCKFYFIHTYQEDVYKNNTLITRENIKEVIKIAGQESQLKLKTALKKIKKLSHNLKHTYKIISANNILVDEVDKVVEEKNVDLIIMGTRGKTNNKNITFGSHTLQVLKYVKCPVLAIPDGYSYKEAKHILFATDYSMPYQERELELVEEIATRNNSIIDVLYISDEHHLSLRKEDNQSFLKEKLSNTKIHFKIT